MSKGDPSQWLKSQSVLSTREGGLQGLGEIRGRDSLRKLCDADARLVKAGSLCRSETERSSTSHRAARSPQQGRELVSNKSEMVESSDKLRLSLLSTVRLPVRTTESRPRETSRILNTEENGWSFEPSLRVYTKTSAMDFTELSTILGTQLGKTRGKSPTSTARDTCNKETRMRRNAALFRLERNTDPTAPELEGTSNLQLWLSTCTSGADHREWCIGVTDREPFVRCNEVKTPTFKSTTSEIVCSSAAKDLSRLLSKRVFARCLTRAQLANVGHDLYSHDNNFLATSSSQVDVSSAAIIQGCLVGRFFLEPFGSESTRFQRCL